MKEVNDFVESLNNSPEHFVLTDEGDIDKILGIEIIQLNDRQFKLSQKFLNGRTISFLQIIKKLKNDVKCHP